MLYKAQRSRNMYTPGCDKPFKLSRAKIEMFFECPRCFYIDRRIGVVRPPSYPFNLNIAVDHLLKKEFDILRKQKKPHEMFKLENLKAIPFEHEDLDIWRENFKGLQVLHKKTNLLLTGAVDDIWINQNDELIVADYKATSKDSKITLDSEWQNGYKRQMEIYQYLLRKMNFKVNSTGYFVYCNALKSKDDFDHHLTFDIQLIPYTGNDSWVDGAIDDIHKCLNKKSAPEPSDTCAYCSYKKALKAQKLI